MPLSSKSGRAGLCKQAAAAPQGWLLLPAVKSSCFSHPPPVGPPAARQDHKNIGGTPTWSGLHQAPAACLKQRGGITATWQRTSLGKSRPRARIENQQQENVSTCSDPDRRTLEPWSKPDDWTHRWVARQEIQKWKLMKCYGNGTLGRIRWDRITNKWEGQNI